MAENTNTERDRAIMEGERNASLDSYSRVVYLTQAESRIYETAFTNGWNRRASLSLPAAGQEPGAWPKDAAEVRAFVGSHFCSLLYANPVSMEPGDNDRYELTAHDLLSAFRWWTEDADPQPAEPIAGKEPEAWQERQQTSTGWTPWYDAELPTSMGKGPGLSEVLGGIEYQWRPLYAAQQSAAPYSIDADPQGIRATVADAITGALAFGAQGANMPPTGHWLAPFWESARWDAIRAKPVHPSADTLYLLRRLLSNQHTLTGSEFRAELVKIVEAAHAITPPAQAAESVGWDALNRLLAAATEIVETVECYDPDTLLALDEDPHPPSTINASSDNLKHAIVSIRTAMAANGGNK